MSTNHVLQCRNLIIYLFTYDVIAATLILHSMLIKQLNNSVKKDWYEPFKKNPDVQFPFNLLWLMSSADKNQ